MSERLFIYQMLYKNGTYVGKNYIAQNSSPLCLNDATEIAYLNSTVVRKALNIPDVV